MNPEIEGSHRLVDRIARSRALDPLADAVQPIWSALLRSNPAVKDFLSGTWVGHSLHVMLTDIPIGAWTVTAAADAIELAGIDRYADASDFALIVGTAGASFAVITGYSDWSDTAGDPKRLGMAHAALNGVAFAGYVGSLALRARGSRRSAAWLSLASYGFASAAAYLGGELSNGMQLGVKHTVSPAVPPDTFTPVCAVHEIAPGEFKRVDVDGIGVLLSRIDGSISAVAATCTHRGAPLEQGERDGERVRCPWHGARFDLRTGEVVEGPATFNLAAFETRTRDGQIEIRFAPA